MARYDSKFLEKSVLLRNSNLPILNGSAKRLRSSSVKLFLSVILGNAKCFSNASGVVLVRKLYLF